MVSSFYENIQKGDTTATTRAHIVRKAMKKKMFIDESGGASTMHAEQEENVECVLGEQQAKCNMHRKRIGCNNNVIAASILAIFMTMHSADASPSKDVQPSVRINKCCEKFEIYIDQRCTNAQEVNTSK